MRSKRTIGLIAGGCLLAAGGALTPAIVLFGLYGILLDAVVVSFVVSLYRAFVQPWHSTWGADRDETTRAMPGDSIVTSAKTTTRAITIHAPPEEVWPWVAQIGYGRAGWYSYDWIDNDGHPSADRILPEFQDVNVGDQIVMVPGMGPRVVWIDPPRVMLSGNAVGGTWCLMLERMALERTRLISRWRQSWKVTPLSLPWIMIVDPGAFIMERKMLRTIKQRAEAAHLEQEDRSERATTAPVRRAS